MGRKNDLVVWLRLKPLQKHVYSAFLSSDTVKGALNSTQCAAAWPAGCAVLAAAARLCGLALQLPGAGLLLRVPPWARAPPALPDHHHQRPPPAAPAAGRRWPR
jgi:hypothetical protein